MSTQWLDLYTEQQKIEAGLAEHTPAPSAENYNIPSEAETGINMNDDVLDHRQKHKGTEFSLAKYCQPYMGTMCLARHSERWH